MCACVHCGHQGVYFRDLALQEVTVQGQKQTEIWLYQLEHDYDFCVSRFPSFFSPKLFISISYFMLLKNRGIFHPSIQYSKWFLNGNI